MEKVKVEVKVGSENGIYEVYVNGAMVKTLKTYMGLQVYLRWLWYANVDKIVEYDLHIFSKDVEVNLRQYLFE